MSTTQSNNASKNQILITQNNVNNKHKYFISQPSPSSSGGSSSSASSTTSSKPSSASSVSSSTAKPVLTYFRNDRSSSPRKIQQQLFVNNDNIVKNVFLRPQIVTNANREINNLYKQNTVVSFMTTPSPSNQNVQTKVQRVKHPTNQENYLNVNDNKVKININLNLNESTSNETQLGSQKAREAFLERLKFTENLKNTSKSAHVSRNTYRSKPNEIINSKSESQNQIVQSYNSYENKIEPTNEARASSISSNGFYRDAETNANLLKSPSANTSQVNYFTNSVAKPFDSKNNFSTVVKIDTKFKSEYFTDKNTVINTNNSYFQNVFENINDFVKSTSDMPTHASNLHRENITNLLNRRQNLNQKQIEFKQTNTHEPVKRNEPIVLNKETSLNHVKATNENIFTSKLAFI